MTFDSAMVGTAASIWRSDSRLTDQPALDLTKVKQLVVVSAHPDDETLGTGGLIATCATLGIDVTVVVVTDGAGSHPTSTTRNPEELASIRSGEVLTAMAALAPDARVIQLGFVDGGTRESRGEITTWLREMLIELPPELTLVVAPWSGDGHRDHRVVGEICAELTEQLALPFAEYLIWFWHWSHPSDGQIPWTRLRSVGLSSTAFQAKAAAIQVFKSQILPISDAVGDEAVLTPSFLEHFTNPIELFLIKQETLRASYFDDLYERHDDPWGFASRWYERRKRAITIAALPDERYGSALEIGCSLGLLTVDLAERVDHLHAVDISQTAVDRARERSTSENVTIERRDVTTSFPDGPFDLVVLSEVGYYLDVPTLSTLLDTIVASLAPGGTVLLCHWRHPVTDYPLSGDEVHALMDSQATLTRLSRHEEKDFLLDVYSLDNRSVAERTGLA